MYADAHLPVSFVSHTHAQCLNIKGTGKRASDSHDFSDLRQPKNVSRSRQLPVLKATTTELMLKHSEVFMVLSIYCLCSNILHFDQKYLSQDTLICISLVMNSTLSGGSYMPEISVRQLSTFLLTCIFDALNDESHLVKKK